jgi:hypothetical protein
LDPLLKCLKRLIVLLPDAALRVAEDLRTRAGRLEVAIYEVEEGLLLSEMRRFVREETALSELNYLKDKRVRTLGRRQVCQTRSRGVVPLKRKVIALGCDALRIEVSLLLFGEVAPRGGIRGPSSLVGAEGSTKTAREDVLD